MPAVINTTEQKQKSDFRDVNYDYAYPRELKLKPGTDLHDKIVKVVLDRARASASVMSKRHSNWKEIDHVLTGYIPLSEYEKKVKDNDERRPVSIVFPYSYAIMETLLSYLCAAFFQDPIFRFEGVGPEDIIGATLMEHVVQLHCMKTKVPLALHTFFRDNLAYGVCGVAPAWEKRTTKRPQRDNGFASSLLQKILGQRMTDQVTFEGNKLLNIDPYCMLLDPSVPVQSVQDGEFFGWIDHSNLMNLLSEEKQSEGTMFNVRYLKHLGVRLTNISSRDNSGRNTKSQLSTIENDGVVNPVDLVKMYLKIVPSEHGLGDSNYPEKWLFTVAADEILIEARPLGLWHDKFPIAIGASEFDGYSTAPISRLETLFGLQGTLDWLFNAHITNVRKAINDVLIYDPYLLNTEDLKNPDEGKLVRTRRPAWGKGVKDSIMQLPVQDVTRGHVADSSFIVQWMQRIGAADDNTMGSLRQGGPDRLTSDEFQGTRQGTVSRLGRITQVLAYQALNDIGEFFASHTQQFMTQDTFVKVSGDWLRRLQEEFGSKAPVRFPVTPRDLSIEYDVVVADGNLPGANYSQVFERMFETMAQHPELAQKFDITKIFTHIARNNGAKNVDEFIRHEVRPNEEVMREREKGNVVPFDQAVQEGMV